MDNTKDLIKENQRLKEEVETYQKGYEDVLTEKLMIEQEYENFKMAIEESKKIKNPGIFGDTTIINIQTDNIKYKDEINEYLNRIWELQTSLSLKEEEIRVLSEKNKELETNIKLLKEEKAQSQTDNEKNENDFMILDSTDNNRIINNSIINFDDLMRSTVLKNKEKDIKKKIKKTVNLNIISEDELEKKMEEEEKERKRKEEEEFERRRKILEEKKNKLLEEEKIKKELEKKINEFDNTKKNLESKFNNIKPSISNLYTNAQKQYEFRNNYNKYVNELNTEINKLKDQLNISLYGEQAVLENQNRNNQIKKFIDSLEIISVKVIQFTEVIDQSCEHLRKAEKIQKEIQEKFNEIENGKKNKDLISLKKIYEESNTFINNNLNELEKIVKILNSNEKFYENSKKDIEELIKTLNQTIETYINKIKKAQSILVANKPKNDVNGPAIDSIFLRGSMLIGINDFGKENDIFSSTNIFKEEDYENCRQQDLLRKNWNEICYVYEQYDIHDIHYELKAVGLPPNTFFSSCSIGFVFDTEVEILQFEMDGKKKDYTYQSYSLEFNIHLMNLQSNKIHLKYKESPLKSKMTEGEKRERKFVKNNYYGISKNIAGQNAKFTLCIKCDYEIIAFEDEFFIKTKNKEYTWGGKVPPEGKRTLVKMSKTKGKFKFLCSEVIKSRNDKPIKSTKMTVPVSFVGGNNEILNIDCSSKQTDNVTLKKDERVYEINFLNTNSLVGEFKIEGELVNRCKDEWVCDLTDKQIEDQVPEDYKYNKAKFKEFAETIIKNYDIQHKNDLIKVPDIVKVGKWIKKNIQYNISYSGRNEITATETLNNRIGVCHHFTKAFNALMYSLGYQVIYVSGYALDKKDTFQKEDAHAWSLVKIDGKWLPFDATWGIFSGKLPVCHVFKQYFPGGTRIIGTDKIEFGKGKDEGKFIEN